jgi:hypothetical protein
MLQKSIEPMPEVGLSETIMMRRQPAPLGADRNCPNGTGGCPSTASDYPDAPASSTAGLRRCRSAGPRSGAHDREDGRTWQTQPDLVT